MTHTKAALDALTDQAIAHLADAQRKHDAVTVVQRNVATDLADMLAVQFAGDTELAGRVAVSAAQALTHLVCEMRDDVPEYQLAPIMVNLLAFAGEQLTHGGCDER
jgi:predicted subunit of tRNA(5-methylaminomethyl-2-thiouridylate) methyltransferase